MIKKTPKRAFFHISLPCKGANILYNLWGEDEIVPLCIWGQDAEKNDFSSQNKKQIKKWSKRCYLVYLVKMKKQQN